MPSNSFRCRIEKALFALARSLSEAPLKKNRKNLVAA
jgi:hypothetical protein